MIGVEAAGAGQRGQGRGGGRCRCLSPQTNRATSRAPSLSASLAASGLLGTARPATESAQCFSFFWSSACAVSRELSRPCPAFRPVEAARISVVWRHRVWGRGSCSGTRHATHTASWLILFIPGLLAAQRVFPELMERWEFSF